EGGIRCFELQRRRVCDGDRTARYRYRSLFKTKCHQVSMEENRNRCIRCRADPASDPDHVWGSAAFVESYCRNHDALCRDCVCVGETKANSLLMENGDVIEPTGSSGSSLTISRSAVGVWVTCQPWIVPGE